MGLFYAFIYYGVVTERPELGPGGRPRDVSSPFVERRSSISRGRSK